MNNENTINCSNTINTLDEEKMKELINELNVFD